MLGGNAHLEEGSGRMEGGVGAFQKVRGAFSEKVAPVQRPWKDRKGS